MQLNQLRRDDNPCPTLNQKIHYRVHNSPQLVLISKPEQYSKIKSEAILGPNFNIILPSTPRSSTCSLPFKFPNQSLYTFNSQTKPRTSHPIYLIAAQYTVRRAVNEI